MPFEPGKSGNPAGVSKAAKPWRNAIRRAVKRMEDGDVRALDRVAMSLINKAMEGDVQAIKEVGDRLDGKAPQQNMLTGANGGPILVSWQK